MSLIVHNVISSSLTVDYSYLDSDELFGYVVRARYTIDVSDVQFEDNGGVLLDGRAAIRTAYEKQNITARIAGDEFVNGLITEVSFPESNLVGSEIVSIGIEERKRLNDYSSKTFAQYIPSPHLIEDFQETYTFTRQDSTYNYTRDISLKYAQDAGIHFLNNAKTFLSNYYWKNRPNLGYYEDGISENARFNNNYVGQFDETIDLIALSVSLTERFDSSVIQSGGYSTKKIEKFAAAADGYLTKTITYEIISLVYDSQRKIESVMGSLIDDTVSDEEDTFGKPYSISKGVTKDSRKGTVTINFSTNPNLSKDNAISFTCQKSKNGADSNYSLSVTYKSTGSDMLTKYDNLMDLWYANRDSNDDKVALLFPEASGVIYEISRSSSLSKSKGQVTDQIVFTTNSAYDSSSLPAGIIKYNLTISKTNKIPRFEKVLDLQDLKEKLVVSSLDSLGQATVTATAISEPSRGLHHAKDFLSTKTTEIENKLGEDNFYLSSDVYTTDTANGTTTRVTSYIIA